MQWYKSMRLIDANVILRYLLQDDPVMAQLARKVIDQGASTNTALLAEVVYVLQKVYRVEREKIAAVLEDLLEDVRIEHKEAVLYALSLYARRSLGFVDCLLAGLNRMEQVDVYTFDEKLNKLLQ